jgi:hypothetical protein
LLWKNISKNKDAIIGGFCGVPIKMTFMAGGLIFSILGILLSFMT